MEVDNVDLPSLPREYTDAEWAEYVDAMWQNYEDISYMGKNGKGKGGKSSKGSKGIKGSKGGKGKDGKDGKGPGTDRPETRTCHWCEKVGHLKPQFRSFLAGKPKTVIGKAAGSLAEEDGDWEDDLTTGSLDIGALDERCDTEYSNDSGDQEEATPIRPSVLSHFEASTSTKAAETILSTKATPSGASSSGASSAFPLAFNEIIRKHQE